MVEVIEEVGMGRWQTEYKFTLFEFKEKTITVPVRIQQGTQLFYFLAINVIV